MTLEQLAESKGSVTELLTENATVAKKELDKWVSNTPRLNMNGTDIRMIILKLVTKISFYTENYEKNGCSNSNFSN